MFETMEISSLQISSEEYLAFRHCMNLSGEDTNKNLSLVINSGESATRIVPVIYGKIQRNGIRTFDLAGSDITKYLFKCLAMKNKIKSMESIRAFKETNCYVSNSFEKSIAQSIKNRIYVLSKVCKYWANIETWTGPEILFRPELLDRNIGGIQETVFNSIITFNPECQKRLLNSIILCGGNTMFSGFSEVLEKKILEYYYHVLNKKATWTTNIQNEKHLAWMGGKILDTELFVNRKSYDEFGINITDSFDNF